MTDSIESIMADAEEVFGFQKGKRPQERAHAYLERRKVRRGWSDTAMLRVVQDLVERAVSVSSLDESDPLVVLVQSLTEDSSVREDIQHKEDA